MHDASDPKRLIVTPLAQIFISFLKLIVTEQICSNSPLLAGGGRCTGLKIIEGITTSEYTILWGGVGGIGGPGGQGLEPY
jgi:hypothetical protein